MTMTDNGAGARGQSNAAAERSAHVTRNGPAPAETVSPCVEVAPGVFRLRAIVERDVEIARLRAEVAALRVRVVDLEEPAGIGLGERGS